MTVRSIRRSIAAVAAGVLTGTMLLAVPADAAPPSEDQLAEFTQGSEDQKPVQAPPSSTTGE
jgi:hypothetical protein